MAHRAKKSDRNAVLKRTEYLVAKRALGRNIKASKCRFSNRQRNDLKNNPWGLGYKIVMRKLGALAKNAVMEAEAMDRIVDALFPTHSKRYENPRTREALEAPPFTLVETQTSCVLIHVPKGSRTGWIAS